MNFEDEYERRTGRRLKQREVGVYQELLSKKVDDITRERDTLQAAIKEAIGMAKTGNPIAAIFVLEGVLK